MITFITEGRPLEITESHTTDDGFIVLFVACDDEADFHSLPAILVFEGRRFSREQFDPSEQAAVYAAAR